ncbi:MAG TPA: hypothetical protein VF225_08765 [Gaiellaceae bacterium]
MRQQAGGFVYVQTNDADHNEVVVFARRGGGALERLDSYRRDHRRRHARDP